MRLTRITLLALLTLALAGTAAAQDPKQALNDQLYEAARKGDVAEVKAVLDKGADVNAKFRYGATALFKAAERGYTEVVKLLIERGADVNVKDTFYGATAMTWALNKEHTGVIRATSLVERNGVIVLDGGSAGVVANSGTLDVAGKDAGTTGGTVKVLGEYVALNNGTLIDASGHSGGGTPAPGEVDLVRAFTMPLPARVIMGILGVPESRLDDIKSWSDDISLFIFSAREAPMKYERARAVSVASSISTTRFVVTCFVRGLPSCRRTTWSAASTSADPRRSGPPARP